ncbi:MAG: aminotransferase class I/II-fold pyridoxal phosphate-dependent enzyme [Opitutaceae bacterium]|jgi:threonine-phosphate decarboxylase|nr:aminotransferase class I/II-fold pyridoxal phosphate-dependent enzyme [Opitutaceae bacterium]
MLYGHGDDARLQPREIRDDFSSNIRPDGPPPGLLGHLRTRIDVVTRYPDAGARDLAARFAAATNVPPENTLVTAGATAAIYLVAQTFRRKRSCIITPTFSEYEDAAKIHEHTLSFATRTELRVPANAAPANTAPTHAAPTNTAPANTAPPADVLWLCEPNNPTGEVLPREQLLALVDAQPATVFVIDQSYAGFCSAPQLRATDAAARDNLILIHSLTKALGIPGLRLGATVSSAALIAQITRHLQPWSVNALALEAGAYYLSHVRDFALPLDDMLANARALSRTISELPGYAPLPSATNFFLVTLARGVSQALKHYLVNGHGILVRDASNFRGLTAQHIRVAAQSPWQNHRLTEALRAWRP